MAEIISYKICAVKVRNAKLRNYLKNKSRQVIYSYKSVLFRIIQYKANNDI